MANIVRTFRSVKHAPTAAARRRRVASVRSGTSDSTGASTGVTRSAPSVAEVRHADRESGPGRFWPGSVAAYISATRAKEERVIGKINLAEQFGRFTDRKLRDGAVLRHTGNVESEMTVPELARI